MVDTQTDYYSILQVSPRASRELIKRAYKTLMFAKKQHPDLGGDTETAARLNEAYRMLSNPAKRLEYDRHRAACKGFSDGETGLYGLLNIAPHACTAVIDKACQVLTRDMASRQGGEKADNKQVLIEEARRLLADADSRNRYDLTLKREQRRRSATCVVQCNQCNEPNYILPDESLSTTHCTSCGAALAAVRIEPEVPFTDNTAPQKRRPAHSPQSWLGKVDHVEGLLKKSGKITLTDFVPYLEDSDGRVRDATVTYLKQNISRTPGNLTEENFCSAYTTAGSAGKSYFLRLLPLLAHGHSTVSITPEKGAGRLLRHSLQSIDETIREAGRETFDELYPKKGRLLREALELEGNSVGDVAIMALTLSSSLVHPFLVAYLNGLVCERDLATRIKGIRLLGRVGGEMAEQILCEILAEDEWIIQEEAARALALEGTSASVTALAEALNSPNSLLREEIVKTLGKIATDDALAILRKTRYDSDWRVRLAAETLLEQAAPIKEDQ